MKRILALLLALCLLPAAFAESTPEPTLAPEVVETIHAVVDGLFAACTGATFETEAEARKDLTDEELTARTEQNREYREITLPWLTAALTWVDETVEPTPGTSPTPQPEATPEPEWTIEDSFAAFALNEQGAAYLDLLSTLGGSDIETCMSITREALALWLQEIDSEKLTEINPDYNCWIYAPGTQIDYPIVHGADNSYYLHRLFDGTWNSAGTLFMDYRNLPDFLDPNTLVYGHHVRNDSMFGSLTEYADQAYFDSHPYMLLIFEGELGLLQLFAGYTTSKHDHCYDIAISDAEDMRAFVAEALSKSDFAAPIEILPSDHLVTLSTCAYAFENARYITIGKLSLHPFAAALEPTDTAPSAN